jgi:hypothetical protein
MNKKSIIILMAIGVLLIGIVGFFNLVKNEQKEIVYDCDDLDVVYLKPSEKSQAGTIARQIKGIAVIPEENYLVADTEILLQCDDLDFSKYIRM